MRWGWGCLCLVGYPISPSPVHLLQGTTNQYSLPSEEPSISWAPLQEHEAESKAANMCVPC